MEEKNKQIAEHCLGWHKTTEAILEDIEKALDAKDAKLAALEALLKKAEEALNHCKKTFDWEHFPEELEVIKKALSAIRGKEGGASS